MQINVSKYGELPLDLEMTQSTINDFLEEEKRDCVRGIVWKDGKLLVVYPKHEVLYGTPGGGVDGSETLEDALRRELLEEVGAEEITIKTYLGCIKEKRNSIYGDRLYTPNMHYYLVEVNKFGPPLLIDYEQKLELTNEFIEIDILIQHNESVLKNSQNPFSPFYSFQLELFKQLKTLFNV